MNLGNWSNGTIDGFSFSVKHFEAGSTYGINDGRISKLEIRKDGKCLAHYERGWDIEVAEEARSVYKALLEKYN
jgi:hypothetical protein